MNIIAGGFYDSVMLYARALNETLTPAGDRPPGKLVNGRLWNRTFQGESRNYPCTPQHLGAWPNQGASTFMFVWTIDDQYQIW